LILTNLAYLATFGHRDNQPSQPSWDDALIFTCLGLASIFFLRLVDVSVSWKRVLLDDKGEDPNKDKYVRTLEELRIVFPIASLVLCAAGFIFSALVLYKKVHGQI